MPQQLRDDLERMLANARLKQSGLVGQAVLLRAAEHVVALVEEVYAVCDARDAARDVTLTLRRYLAAGCSAEDLRKLHEQHPWLDEAVK